MKYVAPRPERPLTARSHNIVFAAVYCSVNTLDNVAPCLRSRVFGTLQGKGRWRAGCPVVQGTSRTRRWRASASPRSSTRPGAPVHDCCLHWPAGKRRHPDLHGRPLLDNVFIRRLWRSLKSEDVYLKGYADGREARAASRPGSHFVVASSPDTLEHPYWAHSACSYSSTARKKDTWASIWRRE